MKRIKDKGLKTLLNLKEDYTLKLDNYKPNDTLKFTEDESSEEEKVELTPKETPDEITKKDSKETSKKDTSEDKSSEKAPEEEEKKDTNTSESTVNYQVNLSNVYSIMRQAKSPADVGLALKAFLKLLQSNSLEALSAVAS